MIINFILLITNVVDDILRLIGDTKNPIVIIVLCFALIVAMVIYGTSKNKSTKEEEDEKEDVFVSENKKLLSQNRIGRVISNLLQYEYQEENQQIIDEVIIISARFHQERENFRKGIQVDSQDMAKITAALLDILNLMQKNEKNTHA